MNDYKDIDNTRYIINRVFAENKTSAMLIAKRVLEEKNTLQTLTKSGTILYNGGSGSIQSKEGL